jgi:hypothetical protein
VKPFLSSPRLSPLVVASSFALAAACAGGAPAEEGPNDGGAPATSGEGSAMDAVAPLADGGIDVAAPPAESGIDAAAPPAESGIDAAAPPADSGGDAIPTDAAIDAPAADAQPDAAEDAGVTALYAAPNGNGTSCTLAAPCTLDQAVTAVRGMTATMAADLHVYLRGGTYARTSPLSLGPSDSGQNGHTVTYEAYPGELPLLSGAVPVTGFSEHDAARGIWQASIPASAAGVVGRQLFVNGVRAVRARSAGSPQGVVATSTGFTTSEGAYATYANPSLLEVVQDNDWKQMRCPLQTVTAAPDGGASLNVLPSCWAGNNTHVPNVGFPLNGSGLPQMQGISWVENAYELLSQPGEFYVDTAGGKVDYIPRSGEDLSVADVELPVVETLVSLRGTPGHLAPQNDTDLGVTYTGSWGHYTGRTFGDLEADVHATASANDSATFAFVGTGIEILGETNSDEASFQVYVDGTLDSKAYTQSSASRVAQQVIYSALGLPNGAHTVKLVNAGTGQYTVIDGFVVLPSAIAPVHDIAFSGITFSYGTWNLPTTVGYIDNQAGVLWDTTGSVPTPTRIQAAVQVHRGVNIAFHGCTFSHLGGAAIDLADGTQQSSVTGSTIEDTSGGGVSIGEVDDYFQTEPSLMTANDTLSNNAIARVGFDYHDAVGIWAGYTRGVLIQHNDVGHTPYSGMSLGWGWGWASSCALQSAEGIGNCANGTIYAGQNQILLNYVHDVMGFLFDGGPIYTNGGQGNGTTTSVLAQNFLTAGNHTNNMLYQDEGSSYWDTHDNVTTLGGSDWIGMWTPTIHDITVGPVNFTDNANTLNNGTNITYTAPSVVTGGAWSAVPAAVAIMQTAGLEPAYRGSGAMRDDDDQALTYAGTWSAQGSRGYGDYQDNVHYTVTNGDAVTLTFTGTSVSFLGELSADQGEVAWSIDGVSQGTANTSAPSGSARQVQQVLFTSPALTAGSHTLKVTKNGGTYMTVDAFRVQP